MNCRALIVAVVSAGCLALALATTAPERKVTGNVITSEHDPSVRIELPKSVQYLGTDHFVLYGIADCELHAFVDADHERKVERLYWVQFEGYLPSKPDLHHTYDSPRHATIGGLDFYVDTEVVARDAKSKPGSDGEHIRSLIRARGYTVPAERMSVRLVHLLDDKRKELMIIYAEDLAATGLTVADLQEGGKDRGQWPGIESGLIERAKKQIAVTTHPAP
jgi:hypothetical protein